MRKAIPFILLCLLPQGARAWDDHTLGTWLAFEGMPEVAKAPAVEAETLESYLGTQSRADFLRSLEVNPNARLPLFLQRIPGTSDSRRALSPADVSTVPKSWRKETVVVEVSAGEKLSALEVLATASDEPDYGLDIGLWSDNGTDYGASYDYGKQPFGNPRIEISSQSPFHMGFFHESKIVYAAAPFLKRTYPEKRIHQYFELARKAFKAGHPYWGWRFTGWALHYVQDLTQPYHARVLPGVSVPEMLWINLLDTVGVHNPKDDRVQLVTNRHFALENYQGNYLQRLLASDHTATDPVYRALRDTELDRQLGPFDPATSPRAVVSKSPAALSSRVDHAIASYLPRQIVSDPKYLFGTTDPNVDVLAILEKGPAEQRQEFEDLLAKLLGPYGAHSRNLVRAVLADIELAAAKGAKRSRTPARH